MNGRWKTKCSARSARSGGSGVHVTGAPPNWPGTLLLIIVTARLGVKVDVKVGRSVSVAVAVGVRVAVGVGVILGVSVGGMGVGENASVATGTGVQDERAIVTAVRVCAAFSVAVCRDSTPDGPLWQAARIPASRRKATRL